MTTEEDAVIKEYVLPADIAETLEYEAEERGIPEGDIITEWMKDGFWVAFHDVDETVVRLKYVDPWKNTDSTVMSPESDGEKPQTLKTFRRLRDEFPPVTAGIEYSKSFTSGGGFTVEFDDSNNKNQQENRDIINEFNRNVYQDEVTVGLDAILDILLDEAFTVGSAAAEIVYEGFSDEGSFQFEDWATHTPQATKTDPQWESKPLKSNDWKKLKGVAQLKVIDNAVERLKPYINPYTYKIEYWTVDEGNNQDENAPEPVKLLPWQVLWLSWGRRGSNLKGVSLIRPVAETAILLESILKAVGTSFRRWSDKKYFFILGNERTGRSWAPPKIREFMHDTKKMIEKGSSGIPVSAGFDIKEIGGEAYSGGSIIDSLVSMITGGMRYPRTFLEQGKSFEGDKAWLAWIVTYASHQKLLRRAIEHQLWERHLYCKVGMTQRVSKQGVPIDQQEMVSVYVPKMQWRSEGKWHQETKLEMLTGILNVANPVGPELKLEVETDIASTLNYNELDLKEARKVLQINQKLSILEAESDLLRSEMLKESLENAQTKKIHLEMIPEIQGLQEKPEPEKRPAPVPLARLAGGVSRSTKPTGTQVEQTPNSGGTRQPNRRTGEIGESVEFDSYEEMFRTIIAFEERNRRNNVLSKMIEVLDKI